MSAQKPVTVRTARRRLDRAWDEMGDAVDAAASAIESRYPADMRAAARQVRGAVERFEAAIRDFEEAHTVRVPA